MAWYNTSWQYRFKVTVDHTKVLEAIDNAYYDFANAPAGFWTHVRSDGGDVRVTQADGTTEVAREVTEWIYASSKGSLFFKATGISTSSDVDFYVYYGNSAATEPSASSTYGKYNVWNANYQAVYHMDDGTDTSHIADSTSNQVTGTKSGAATPALNASGKVGQCQQFAADSISLGTALNFSGACTGQFWFKTASTTGMMFKLDSGAVNGNEFTMQLDESGHTLSYCRNYLSGGGGSTLVNTSNWFFYVNTSPTGSGVTGHAYINDGSAQGTYTTASDSATTSYFGRRESNSQSFTGYIDEARFMSVEVSTNYLRTDYANQNSPSTFWTTGSEENVPAATSGFFLFA